MNTTAAKNTTISLMDPSFLALFNAYKAQSKGGICKNKIYHIIKELLTRTGEEELIQFLQAHP